MMARRHFIARSTAGMVLAAHADLRAWPQERATTGPKTGYAPVNGLNLYYEIHGSGEPLILLLGGGQKDAGLDGSGRSAELAILPGLTHYNISASPLLPTVVAPFLDAQSAAKAN
jgi:hypothetical protein